ncbi:MAG: hypothetical protein BWY09_00376 [Candidatus Hydrogenedentes bacterium ADurb.Bin179]|nr:MAG: hypothetical protein BWY09_00376 [Candidatus Hydrogenedentes bacterium ADurb.Bin179]
MVHQTGNRRLRGKTVIVKVQPGNHFPGKGIIGSFTDSDVLPPLKSNGDIGIPRPAPPVCQLNFEQLAFPVSVHPGPYRPQSGEVERIRKFSRGYRPAARRIITGGGEHGGAGVHLWSVCHRHGMAAPVTVGFMAAKGTGQGMNIRFRCGQSHSIGSGTGGIQRTKNGRISRHG